MTRWILLLALLGQPAFADGIYRYEAPDGSLAFTDDAARVPSAAQSTVRTVKPTDARWTKVDRIAPSYRWTNQPSYAEQERAQRFGAAAEAQRRQIEDARALEVLAGEIGVGRGAARVHAEQAERRFERLEDACRAAGCLPGSLRNQ